MTKSAEYIQFEEGFLKVAKDHGCDTTFLRGYLKEADEIVEMWKNAFDELEKEYNDPQYKTKIASELIRFSMIAPELQKKAGITDQFGSAMSGMTEGGVGNWQKGLEGMLGNGEGVMGAISKFLQSNPNMLSSLLTGAGGGGLAGLLIGALVKHPMAGMMLGGLVGAGGGAYMGNQGLRDSLSNIGKPAPKAQPDPNAALPAVKPTGDEGVDKFTGVLQSGEHLLDAGAGPQSAEPSKHTPMTVNPKLVPQVKPPAPAKLPAAVSPNSPALTPSNIKPVK